MSRDHLAELTARIDALGGQSVAAHPGVLDEVHHALVDELDRLAAAVRRDGDAQPGPDVTG